MPKKRTRKKTTKRKKPTWLQKANRKMIKKGTKGSFTRAAKARGQGVQQYARNVIRRLKGKTKTAGQKKLLKRAVFARNMKLIANRRKRRDY